MSSAAQLKTITTQLTDYFNKISLNLTSTVNALPSFEDYTPLLVYDLLLTDALGGADRAASLSTGALTDSVHFTTAILREFDMRVKTKSVYFADGQVDSGLIADYFSVVYGLYLNYIRGTSPEQNRV